MTATYLVTVTETYVIEADSEAEAVAEVKTIRPSAHADTVDIAAEQIMHA